MGAFIDGWRVLQSHSIDVLVLTACVVWGGTLVLWLLGDNQAAAATLADQVSLVSSSWVLPGLLLSAIGLLAQRWLGPGRAGLVLILLLLLTALPVRWHLAKRPTARLFDRIGGAGLLIAATIALLVLRLAFVQDVLLPQYFDSATHYGLIRQFVQWAAQASPGRDLVLPVGPYYHVGYHFMLAGLAGAAQLDIGSLMLVSGQLVLALTPLAMYALAHRLSGSGLAAVIAVALAAAGWYMPAFAANWGKYPALFSVLAAIAALTLWVLALDSAGDVGAQRRLWILSLLMTAAAGVLHTRSIAVVAAGVAGMVLARQLWKLPVRWRLISVGLSLASVLGLVWLISISPSLRPVLEPYYGSGSMSTLIAGVLGMGAFRYRPQIALAICLFSALLLSGLLIPTPWQGLGGVLDRPFVELWIFAPLSILGAVGFAAFIPHLGSRGSRFAAVIIAGAIVSHALVTYDPKASACCTIVSPDDLVALDWLGSTVKPPDRVAIAFQPLQLGPGRFQTLEAPVDAGAWINPLTGLTVVPLSSDVDPGVHSVRENLCQLLVRYIYVGGSGRGFDAAALQNQPEIFTVRLQLPGASVLEIRDCEE